MTPGHDNAARGGWSSRQWGQGKHLTETERGKHTETDSYSLMYCSLFNTIHINNNNNNNNYIHNNNNHHHHDKLPPGLDNFHNATIVGQFPQCSFSDFPE